jgi:hypothetical protein
LARKAQPKPRASSQQAGAKRKKSNNDAFEIEAAPTLALPMDNYAELSAFPLDTLNTLLLSNAGTSGDLPSSSTPTAVQMQPSAGSAAVAVSQSFDPLCLHDKV